MQALQLHLLHRALLPRGTRVRPHSGDTHPFRMTRVTLHWGYNPVKDDRSDFSRGCITRPTHPATATSNRLLLPAPTAAGASHARLFVGVSQSQFFRDLVNFWRYMPTKRLQERPNGSKNDLGMPPRRAFCGQPEVLLLIL